MSGYVPSIILGEEDWSIDLDLPTRASREAAEHLANAGSMVATLVVRQGRPGIEVRVEDEARCYFDEDVVITEISETKRAQMGPPLDMRIAGNADKALDALISGDPAYTVDRQDMVASSRDLAAFVERYGEGYRMEAIAYRVRDAGDGAA